MKEQGLTFRTNIDNDTLVVFDEKTLKAYTKANNDLYFVSAELAKNIKENRLTEGYKEVMLGLIESHCTDLTKSLGHEGVLAREKEERFADIRRLNGENRELRKQLGEKASPEDIRESLKNYADIFKRWWNIKGFGHCSDEQFSGHSFTVKLSGMLTDAYYDKDLVGDEKEKAKYLRSLGFEVRNENSKSDRKILHTDKNVQLLIKLLKERFPSVYILDIKSWFGSNDEPEFRDIRICITNYDDFIV